ncbi:MAG: hypothetical protein V1779_13070 [bacterium]
MKKVFTLFTAITVVLLMGCPENDTTQPQEQKEFKIGQITEHVINQTTPLSILDSTIGCTFYLPNGGSGTLQIASVTSGPPVTLYENIRFFVNYSGNEPIQLMIPHKEGDFDYLYYYGVCKDISWHKDDAAVNWWHLMYIEEKDGYLYFDLNPRDSSKFFGCKKEKVQKYESPNSNYFSLCKIPASASNFLKQSYHRATINEIIELWLKDLPKNLKDSFYLNINGNGKYNILTAASECNSFQAFDNWFFQRNAIFNLEPLAELSSIAHETGHYMNFIISGYSKYQEIYGRMPKNLIGSSVGHEPGFKYNNRNCFLEDYAYFSDFLANETVMRYDPYNYKQNLRLSLAMEDDKYQGWSKNESKLNHPNTVDFPSVEGFGIQALLCVTRDEKMNEVYTYDAKDKKTKTKVPSLNVPIKDIILYILLRSPRDINEMTQYMIDYLWTHQGGQVGIDKFFASVEPLGWSYHGDGIVVDNSGKPIKDATVKNLIFFSAKENYSCQTSAKTGSDGKFTLWRMYPGNSILRIYYNNGKDSMDFEQDIDWKKPTNEKIQIGNLKVNQTTKYTLKIDFSLDEALGFSGNPVSASVNAFMNISKATVGKKGINFTGLSTSSAIYELNIHLTGFAEAEPCIVDSFFVNCSAPKVRESGLLTFNSNEYGYIKYIWKGFGSDYNDLSEDSRVFEFKKQSIVNKGWNTSQLFGSYLLEAVLYDKEKVEVKRQPHVVWLKVWFKPM